MGFNYVWQHSTSYGVVKGNLACCLSPIVVISALLPFTPDTIYTSKCFVHKPAVHCREGRDCGILSAPLWGAAVLHAVTSPQQTVWLSTCSSRWGKGEAAGDSDGGRGLRGQRVAFCVVMGEVVSV